MNSFEFFEHTADVGMNVQADSLAGLFETAARGLYALMLENPEVIQPSRPYRIELAAEDLTALLADWLQELIFRFETEGMLLCDLHCTIDQPLRMMADCWGEPVDWARHLPGSEPKGVTYHGLRVEQDGETWRASVIIDI